MKRKENLGKINNKWSTFNFENKFIFVVQITIGYI